jgi:arylsulfatase A-like enzyme
MEDVTGMPEYIQDSPRFTSDEQGAIDRLYRRRIRSLQAIDRGVRRLVDTLRSTHELSRTYFVFTSDNGYHLGQHRLPAGKKTPYDTDTHVPFLVRGPGVPAGSDVAALSGNVDIAPTFAAARTSPPAASDGRSSSPCCDARPP